MGNFFVKWGNLDEELLWADCYKKCESKEQKLKFTRIIMS